MNCEVPEARSQVVPADVVASFRVWHEIGEQHQPVRELYKGYFVKALHFRGKRRLERLRMVQVDHHCGREHEQDGDLGPKEVSNQEGAQSEADTAPKQEGWQHQVPF